MQSGFITTLNKKLNKINKLISRAIDWKYKINSTTADLSRRNCGYKSMISESKRK